MLFAESLCWRARRAKSGILPKKMNKEIVMMMSRYCYKDRVGCSAFYERDGKEATLVILIILFTHAKSLEEKKLKMRDF